MKITAGMIRRRFDTRGFASRAVVLFMIGLLLISSATAETTFVAGAVSGVWSAEHSPYIITDSAWVPAGNSLTATAGVTIIMANPLSKLGVMGSLRLLGSATDSVRVVYARMHGLHSSWAPLVEMAYTAFSGTYSTALSVDTLRIRHCWFQPPPNTNPGLFSAVFRQATVDSSRAWNFNLGAGREWARVTAMHVDYALNVDAPTVIADQLTADPASFNGAAIGSTFTTAGLIRVSNSALTYLDIDQFQTPLKPVTVQNVTAFAELSLSHLDNCSVEQCRLDRLRLDQVSGVIAHNIVGVGSTITGDCQLMLRNNTFVQPVCCHSGDAIGFFTDISTSPASNLALVNNLFLSQDPELQIYSEPRIPAPFAVSYNIAFGMRDPWHLLTLGTGNLVTDPLADPNDSTYALSAASPAINSGNPVWTDADGTCSDIGARWWDHRYDHAPTILTPRRTVTGWGEHVTFALTAVDEGAVTLSYLTPLPDWMLTRSSLDEQILLYNGTIPYGAETFSVVVLAQDAGGQMDRDTVVCEIRPHSTLADTSWGTLTAEHSPYLVYQDVHVLPTDSLTLEPGVRVRFAGDTCQSTLFVRGTLLAQGTATDSVYFELASGDRWRGLQVLPRGTLDLNYSRLTGTFWAVQTDTAALCRLTHSQLQNVAAGTYNVLTASRTDSVVLNQCTIDG